MDALAVAIFFLALILKIGWKVRLAAILLSIFLAILSSLGVSLWLTVLSVIFLVSLLVSLLGITLYFAKDSEREIAAIIIGAGLIGMGVVFGLSSRFRSAFISTINTVLDFISPYLIEIGIGISIVLALIISWVLVRRLRAHLRKKLEEKERRAKYEARRKRQSQADKAYQAIPKTDRYDLVDLINAGALSLRNSEGKDIELVKIELVNETLSEIRAIARAGTMIRSGGAHQDMVVTHDYEFSIRADYSIWLTLRAACATALRPIPTKNDTFFSIGRGSDNLQHLLVEMDGYSSMAIQAAVWAITDKFTPDESQRHLRKSSGEFAISDRDIESATRMLKKMGYYKD